MHNALVRYLAAATLARGADAGFLLLAETTPQVPRPPLVGARLVTCLTAPHPLGPVLAAFGLGNLAGSVAASAGAAAAGASMVFGPRPLLAAGAVMILAAALVTVADRRAGRLAVLR